MSFFFSVLSFFFKLCVCVCVCVRERDRGYIKLGIRRNSPKFTYLISLMEFLWRIFLLLRADKLYLIFNTGLKNLAPSCPRYFFVFFYREYWLWFCLPRTLSNHWFSYSLFRWREEGATSVLGFQPIVWLLPSSFPCLATRGRSPSTNICS